MAKSSATTARATASQSGSGRLWNSPPPRPSAASAMPTAPSGNTSRTATVLRTVRARLLNQRAGRAAVRGRRGARASQAAIRASTPAKQPSRTADSWVRTFILTWGKDSEEPTTQVRVNDGALTAYRLPLIRIRQAISGAYEAQPARSEAAQEAPDAAKNASSSGAGQDSRPAGRRGRGTARGPCGLPAGFAARPRTGPAWPAGAGRAGRRPAGAGRRGSVPGRGRRSGRREAWGRLKEKGTAGALPVGAG